MRAPQRCTGGNTSFDAGPGLHTRLGDARRSHTGTDACPCHAVAAVGSRDNMRRLISLITACLVVVNLPRPALAAEPAWWTQKKRECGISMPYNTWVAQGMPCG